MIKVVRNYSDIPSEDQLLKMMGDQMSHIGSSPEIERLKSALKNALYGLYYFIFKRSGSDSLPKKWF